jgi:anti-sigma B factor antagonist
MPEIRNRFRVVSGVPVVSAPAEIDITAAYYLRAALRQAGNHGHVTVVDMTGTWLCDSAGLSMLLGAHKRALADGGELRLVIPAGAAVLRVFMVTGVDQLIPRFASVPEAVAQLPETARPPRLVALRSPDATAGALAEAWERGQVGDIRTCEQCGIAFVPLREHARFCSVGCRTAWNAEHLGDPAVQASALEWSVVAMSEAIGRLAAVKVWDRLRALAAIEEAVWWTTMVDATLVRHHRDAYEAVLAARDATERRRAEATLAGLRFVRNRIGGGGGLDGLVRGEPMGTGHGRITGWTWQPAQQPAPGRLRPRGQAWEMARYRAYQAQLARGTIGETFRRAVPFLTFTGANVASATMISARTRNAERSSKNGSS